MGLDRKTSKVVSMTGKQESDHGIEGLRLEADAKICQADASTLMQAL